MSITQIDRDSQIKPATAYNWVTNDSSGKMSQTAVTASKAVASDANGLPVASATTATQLGYLQGLTSLTVGDVINVSSGGNLQDSGIASSNLFLANGSVSATAAFNLGGFKITNLADPTSPQDAATKNYVDNLVNGITWKTEVQAATAAALASNTYANGTAGVGATLTATANAALTVDGYTVAVNDRILVKNEATASHNGIYVVTQTGSGSLPYILTRSSDMNTPAEVPAATVLVEQGTANADTGWVCTTQPPVTIGTTAITFVLFGTVNTYFAGSGLDLSSNTFSITTDNSLTANAGNSNPSLVVKNSATGAITTTGSGLAVSVDGSTIDISANALEVKAGGITNTQVSASAGIVYSKLSLTNSIVNSDISSSAAIAYSKLNLSSSIVNSDISASAAIAFSKLAALTSANILVGNGSNVATSVSLSGDATLSNTGALTLATVNSNVGTFTYPSVTVNAKGLVTAISSQTPVTSITGTTNQVIASASTGAVTLSLPQDINTTSSPSFQQLTLGSTTLGGMVFNDTEGTPKTVTVTAPTTITSSYSLKWPLLQGGASTVLSNDGSGNLSWAAALTTTLATNDIFLGNGSNIATAVPMTGDVSITYSAGNGVTSISSGLATHFVTRETPSGTINGSNVTFTLANTPVVGTECVFLNGLLQNAGGNDYSISSGTITFTIAPESGSVLLVNYQK